MTIFIDPCTRQRILVDDHCGDFTYDLQGDDAIAKEDVVLIGPWSDWTGSDSNVSSKSQQFFSSSENQLQGTESQIVSNAKLPNLSVIGTNVGTHRRRVIKRYHDGKFE
jgi:hypothetical protein